MPDPKPEIKPCPVHKDSASTGCPNCVLYMKSQGYFVGRNVFKKAEGDAPKPNSTPVPAQPEGTFQK